MTTSIALQIEEAEQHARQCRAAAQKRGPGQSEAQMRLNVAEAIVATLRWNAANETSIREWQTSK